MERAEQDRIRKEFEKDKAAAKAKLARDKKKEKEMQEKQRRRKSGMPLVDCRPSQASISGFARPQTMTKKPGLFARQPQRKFFTAKVEVKETAEDHEHDTPKATHSLLVESPAADIDRVTETDPDVENESKSSEPQQPAATVEVLQPPQATTNEVEESTTDEGHITIATGVDFVLDDDEFDLGMLDALDCATTEQLEVPYKSLTHISSPPKAPDFTMLEDQVTTALPSAGNDDVFVKPALPIARFSKQPLHQSPREQSPPACPAFQCRNPPPSTQAILCNLDDFFPTSSQQARELEEVDDEESAGLPEIRWPPPQPQPAQDFNDRFAFGTDIESFDSSQLSSGELQQLLPLDEKRVEPEQPEQQQIPLLPDNPSLQATTPSAPIETSPGKKRFFTSSGSNELFMLALYRSRRSADLEELRRRDQQRVELGDIMLAQEEAEKLKRKEAAKEARRQQEEKQEASRKEQEIRDEERKAQREKEETEERREREEWDMEEERRRLQFDREQKRKKEHVDEDSGQVDAPFPKRQKQSPPLSSGRHSQKLQQRYQRAFELVNQKRQASNPSPDKAGRSPVVTEADKENARPAMTEDEPDASQETEYGGSWVDELAMELLV